MQITRWKVKGKSRHLTKIENKTNHYKENNRENPLRGKNIKECLNDLSTLNLRKSSEENNSSERRPNQSHPARRDIRTEEYTFKINEMRIKSEN